MTLEVMEAYPQPSVNVTVATYFRSACRPANFPLVAPVRPPAVPARYPLHAGHVISTTPIRPAFDRVEKSVISPAFGRNAPPRRVGY